MTNTPPKKNRKYYFIFIVFTSFLLFYAFSKNKDYNNLKDVLTQDKRDLQTELNRIIDDYGKLNIKNKKLSKRVINEINKVIALKDSVNKLEAKNYSLIRNYRNKTAQLQKENRYLLVKLDSLNTINTYLKEENLVVTKVLSEKNTLAIKLKNQNNNLTKVNQKLEEQIAPAKEIQTSDIKATALKERSSGKLAITERHNRTDAIRINFKLLENNLTSPGDKKILIQLTDIKDNVIAAKSEEEVLKNDNKIKYSDKLIADYKNKELDVLSLILVDRENMEKGNYKINVFIDGNFSSSSIVALK